ncbi:response regulator [Dokdonella sp.]|uniref:response regulator transcription factor n=1 Tax=Dokdonella sp. TaxID=2291710 RepID=UPI002626EEAE|nr:response regulator [Dokdonella sp.]
MSDDHAAHVFLVDDNDEFRESTRWLLEDAGFLVSDFAGGADLLRELDRAAIQPACIVSDVRMPQMSGIELQQELKRRNVELPLVFVTAHADVPLAVEAMRNGAANFIEKPFDPLMLVHALRTVTDRTAVSAANAAAIEKLTPRERQVLELVVAGKLNKTIADVLGISIKTVELHRSNLMQKLGARNVAEVIRIALGHEQPHGASTR